MKPIVLKFGGYQASSSVHNQAGRRFGEILKQKLGEHVTFELIGSVLDLGRPSGDLVPMVERGELSFCYMSTVRFSKPVPDLQLFELPFIVKDRARAFKLLDGQSGARFKERIVATSQCRVLGFWDNGFRHLTNRVRPIRKPEDCKGLRIRTQMTPLHGETFRALGFDPIAADIKEFVEGIAGERFQAHDNALTNIDIFHVYKYHRYITLSGHFWGASAMVCNKEHYAAWPADVRTAVDAAAAEATVLQRKLAAEQDAEVLQKLAQQENEVIHLTDAEHAAFVSAVQPVVDKYRKQIDPKLFELLGA
ncbi:MAG: TRAP transporter substrate-binding protein [Gammaproteobacteria bacterium]|nr:TRAP transporter substrate-binding protein [Gammaproteobacteria bacterium]MDH3412731.1 TRAP transporter substrate-binding protein [Gammaproteobacteria bacterium]